MKVCDILNEDSTYPELRQDIERGFPHTKKRQKALAEVRIQNIQYLPLRGYDLLRIISATKSNSGSTYKQFIDLRNVNFNASHSDMSTTFTAKDGNTITIDPIELNATNVGVNCNCKDYEMRFASFNIKDNSHIGPIPPKYVRKTTDRPSVNPYNVQGVCKHIIKVIEELKKKRLLK